jgi:hypothetical protein
MNRRHFLKVLNSPLAIPFLSLLPTSSKSEQIGFVREVAQYHIGQDTWYIQHDILTDKGQWSFDQKLPCGVRSTKAWGEIEEKRATALQVLWDKLRRENLSWSDLKHLSLPEVGRSGYAKHIIGRAAP